MPVSKDGDVQTDHNVGGKLITLSVGSNGRTVNRKVSLRTKDRRLVLREASSDGCDALDASGCLSAGVVHGEARYPGHPTRQLIIPTVTEH